MWSYAKNDWQRSYLNSTILFVCLLYIYRIDSVTRFGEISPFVQYFRTLWQNFKCLIWIWQNFWPSLAFKICYWAIFLCYKIAKFWTSDLAIWSNWIFSYFLQRIWKFWFNWIRTGNIRAKSKSSDNYSQPRPRPAYPRTPFYSYLSFQPGKLGRSSNILLLQTTQLTMYLGRVVKVLRLDCFFNVFSISKRTICAIFRLIRNCRNWLSSSAAKFHEFEQPIFQPSWISPISHISKSNLSLSFNLLLPSVLFFRSLSHRFLF